MNRAETARPLRPVALWLSLAAAALLSVLVLPWDVSHLATAGGWSSAWARMGSFAEGFARPDVTTSTLQLALRLALETLAIAVLGMVLGLVLAYPLAVCASDSALDDGARSKRWSPRLLLRESVRLVLDALRGIPDFAWALVVLTIFGPTPITAVLAIAVHVAGILGKIFSELWDSVPRTHGDVLRGTGAGRLGVLLYGTQPLAGRAMLSFLLMRFECTVRNASVIGAVCGGGLGAAVLQELGYDNKSRAVTFLCAGLVLTIGVDFVSNALRRLLRAERSVAFRKARNRRRVAAVVITTAIGWSLFQIREPILALDEELRRLDLRFLKEHFGQLLSPDLGADVLLEAVQGMAIPVALGVLSTLIAAGLAAGMAWFGSASFQIHSQAFAPERRPAWLRVWRVGLVSLTRVSSAVLRGVPDVAWVWILALFFLTGIEAALFALVLHSAGLLARVFTETVDNLSYARLEQVGAPSRGGTFLYGALPSSRADWRSYALFQFESNVRVGVILGIVGVGGVGHLFRRALAHGAMDRASTFLISIVVLTVVIDRLSRRIQSGPRC